MKIQAPFDVTARLDPLHSYVERSSRPLASLLFVSPLLVVYELGVMVLGPHALRNGADVWLRRLLELAGFSQYVLLPLLTVGGLLAWHHIRRDRWEISKRTLGGMAAESLALAGLLYFLAHVQHLIVAHWSVALTGMSDGALPAIICNVPDAHGNGTLVRLVGYCGAGIYEELLFRLMLIPLVLLLLARTGWSSRTKLGWAIVLTSAVFSLAHYNLVTPGGYPFSWYSFFFRFGAGAFFAVLFVLRGFGITAGTHTFFDILVELL